MTYVMTWRALIGGASCFRIAENDRDCGACLNCGPCERQLWCLRIVSDTMQPIRIYELVTGENRYFSPFCWATRLAVIHKHLPVETVPWRFRQQDKIAFSGQSLVRK